eukprot:6629359-Pyramimonas_sp.AAC.1
MQTDGGDKGARVEEPATMNELEHVAEFDDQDYENEDHDKHQGADPEAAKPILKGKDKEMDAMEVFDISDAVESLPKPTIGSIRTIYEMGERTARAEEWTCRFVAREFKCEDPELEGLFTAGATSSTGRLIGQSAAQHGYNTIVSDAQNVYFHATEDEEVDSDPPAEWVKRYHARGGQCQRPQ